MYRETDRQTDRHADRQTDIIIILDDYCNPQLRMRTRVNNIHHTHTNYESVCGLPLVCHAHDFMYAPHRNER